MRLPTRLPANVEKRWTAMVARKIPSRTSQALYLVARGVFPAVAAVAAVAFGPDFAVAANPSAVDPRARPATRPAISNVAEVRVFISGAPFCRTI
jgi:hypothetical protein